jgi:hypothetical protein
MHRFRQTGPATAIRVTWLNQALQEKVITVQCFFRGKTRGAQRQVQKKLKQEGIRAAGRRGHEGRWRLTLARARASEGDDALLDAEVEEEDDEARGDALRAGHHRLVVRQQRHGGAHAPDQEPAQVPIHAAAAASCLRASLPIAAPPLAWMLFACGADRGRDEGRMGKKKGS